MAIVKEYPSAYSKIASKTQREFVARWRKVLQGFDGMGII
jgi:hypothetical protein